MRAAEDALQLVGLVSKEKRMVTGFCDDCRSGLDAGRADARQHVGQSAPLGDRRKRGVQAQAIGRSRGRQTIRLHALVDGHKRLVAFMLTPGQRGDAPVAAPLVASMPPLPPLPPTGTTTATPFAPC